MNKEHFAELVTDLCVAILLVSMVYGLVCMVISL